MLFSSSIRRTREVNDTCGCLAVCICMAISVIITVAGSWSFAVRAGSSLGRPVSFRNAADNPDTLVLTWKALGHTREMETKWWLAEDGEVTIAFYSRSNDLPRIRIYTFVDTGLNRLSTDEHAPPPIIRERFGWPLPALYSEFAWQGAAGWKATRGTPLLHTTDTADLIALPRALPIRVIWGNAIIDIALIFATILLIGRIIRRLRNSLRHRGGRCTSCGHILLSSSRVCPECAAAKRTVSDGVCWIEEENGTAVARYTR